MPTGYCKPMPIMAEKYITRFHLQIRKGEPTECWPWTGCFFKGQYGHFTIMVDSKQSSFKAHRIAYFLATGDDPGDLLVMHSCDNPPCCNPAHLSKGDALENSLYCLAKGRNKPPRGDAHPRPSQGCFGDKSPHHKLSDAAVASIKARLRSGEFQKNIAADYGIGQSHVSMIARGVIWAHIE